MMTHAKSKFESKIIDSLQSGQPSSLYSYIHSISGQNRIPPVVNLDNSCAVSDHDKASLYNQYFYFVFTTSEFRLPPVKDLPRPQSTLGEIIMYNIIAHLSPWIPLKLWGVMVLVQSL